MNIPRRELARMLSGATVVVFVLGAWWRRWTCDDAFINFRIVRQIQAGNGPVFNVGDRVEAATSTLWLAILALADTVTPFRIETLSVVLGIAFAASGLACAMAGSTALLRRTGHAAHLPVPAGALVWLALPPARDYATSGLESGLIVGWIGFSWWLVASFAERSPGRRWPLAVIGLGFLVRPDLAIVSVGFASIWLMQMPRRRRDLVTAVAVFAAPATIVQIGRMAYYGMVVPNTAIAKEASTPNWSQGWDYFADLVGPYQLWIPLLALFAVALLLTAERRQVRLVVRLVLPVVAAGVVNAVYVVRVGGDYMHARMLLPALFTLLLPVAVVPLKTASAVATAVVALWAGAAVVALGPSYSRVPAGEPVDVADVFDRETQISDERLTHVALSGRANPVTVDDHGANIWRRGALGVRDFAARGGSGLVLDGESVGNLAVVLPLDPSVGQRVVVQVGAVGMYGYTVGTDVRVVDRFGLADPLVSHHRLESRGRPGHEKNLPIEWVIARYTPAGVSPEWVDAGRLELAREALRCEPMTRLLDASSADAGWGGSLRNLVRAPRLTAYRFAPDPAVAFVENC